jgi:acyl carrier protein
MSNIENKIKEVMALIFNVDILDLPDNCTYGDYDPWDSLSHMNLIVALEEEFMVQLSDDDVINMMSISLACSIIKANVASK